jgi:hypothetical protein
VKRSKVSAKDDITVSAIPDACYLFFYLNSTFAFRQRSRLETYLIQYCRLKSENPRDKLYGLFRLAEVHEHAVVDYKKSIQGVFLDALKILFEAHFERVRRKDETQGARSQGDVY